MLMTVLVSQTGSIGCLPARNPHTVQATRINRHFRDNNFCEDQTNPERVNEWGPNKRETDLIDNRHIQGN